MSASSLCISGVNGQWASDDGVKGIYFDSGEFRVGLWEPKTNADLRLIAFQFGAGSDRLAEPKFRYQEKNIRVMCDDEDVPNSFETKKDFFREIQSRVKEVIESSGLEVRLKPISDAGAAADPKASSSEAPGS